jgi:hypothetical protein
VHQRGSPVPREGHEEDADQGNEDEGRKQDEKGNEDETFPRPGAGVNRARPGRENGLGGGHYRMAATAFSARSLALA